MTTATLFTAAAFAIVTAAVYFFVGYSFSGRATSGPDRTAARMFVVWWYGIAASTVISAIQTLAGAFGFTSLPFFIALNQVALAAVSLALLGLLHYLVYLFTGKDILWGLSAFYLATYVVLVYYIQARVPVGVIVHPWVVELEYAEPPSGPFFIIILLLILLPQLLGAIAYFSIYFRLDDRTQRYRVALVSWAIIVWFGSSLLASVSGLTLIDWWQVVSRAIGLVASLVILAAYLPPAWVQRRYHIESIRMERGAAD